MTDLRRLDLAHLAQDAVEQLRSLVPRGVDVRLSAQWGTVAIEGDPGALRHLITTLALETCGRCGGPQLRLEVRRAPEASTAGTVRPIDGVLPTAFHHLDIVCTAMAPAPDSGARIPVPGDRTSGLDDLVVRHRGGLEARADGGVRLLLPAAPERRSPERLRREAALETPIGRMEGGDETILLVDDDETLRRTGKRILERLGYRVLVAGDGEAALEVFRQHAAAIALVISDVRMPRMGGLELVARLREEGSAVRVLIASGSMGSEAEPGVEVHGLPVIGKPWGLAEFAARVRRVLDAGGEEGTWGSR